MSDPFITIRRKSGPFLDVGKNNEIVQFYLPIAGDIADIVPHWQHFSVLVSVFHGRKIQEALQRRKKDPIPKQTNDVSLLTWSNLPEKICLQKGALWRAAFEPSAKDANTLGMHFWVLWVSPAKKNFLRNDKESVPMEQSLRAARENTM